MNCQTASLRGLRAAVLLSTAMLAAATSTRAAVITWGAATNISSNSDVSTHGSLAFAYNMGASGVADTTVNGVTFALFASGGNNALGSAFAPFSMLSSEYQALLSSAFTLSSMSLFIRNLTIGNTYEFEWWSNSSNGIVASTTATLGNSVTLNSNTTGTLGGLGQFAIGTFVADGSSAVINFTSGALVLLNGFQMRDQGVVAATAPDAGSTVLLLAGALGALGFIARRVRRSPQRS